MNACGRGTRRALVAVMLTKICCAVAFSTAALLACTAGTGGSSIGGSSEPQTEAHVTAPTSGLVITASISAATLGEECASAGGGFAAGDCAPTETDGGSSKAPAGGCGGNYCQQSNVQIAFAAGAGSRDAHVEVVSVSLIESATGKIVDTLTASKPQACNGSAYAAWDQTIKPAGELKASYDLSAPAWSTISSSTRTTSLYSTNYKLNVTLRIDGVEITLQSTDLNREPQVAT